MTSEADAFAYRPLISVITPVYNTDAHWLEACAASVRAQAYSHWQWCIGNDGSTREETRAALDRIAASDLRIRLIHAERNGGIAAATNLALGHAEGEYVALMDSDDALLPHALYEVAAHLNHVSPRADVVYSDEDKLDLNGQRCDAYFKPDWSLDLFLSSMFVCHLLVARRQLVLDVGAFRSEFDYSQDYDLMLRLMEKATRIDHIPTILYHWRKIPMSGALVGDAKPTAHTAAQKAIQDHLNRSGIQGHVEDAGPPGLHRVRYHIPATPLVSIILPTRGSASTTLSATIGALVASTAYANFEVVIVSDDGAVPEEARATLARVPHRIERSARGDRPFNLSATINQGVAASRGEHVLVLHDDAQPRNRDWLTAMLELSTQPGIGAVGAKLFYPHGALQHAGLILGVNGVAGRPFQGHSPATLGYYSGAICIRGYSAVSGACLMTRREVFERVGGFDEGLPLHWSDVDYCLKVGAGGYRVVFTPYAELTHAEAGQLEQLPPAAGSLERLRARWGDRLARDPYYNPNLTREFLDYRVAVE
jgi:GT2 family glycosyltransferase